MNILHNRQLLNNSLEYFARTVDIDALPQIKVPTFTRLVRLESPVWIRNTLYTCLVRLHFIVAALVFNMLVYCYFWVQRITVLICIWYLRGVEVRVWVVPV